MDDLLALLDAWLDLTSHREQFSADEVSDRLLDMRKILTSEPVAP